MPELKVNSDDNSPKGKINKKLRALGVNGFTVREPLIGPVVTGYPIGLSPSTSISQILNKSEDIALMLGVDSVDIRRVKDQVIIFVPNSDRKVVDFKDALFWMAKDEEVSKMHLPLILGTNFQGNNSAIDLAKQPHVLIAGSTGSGKSIFESAIIASLCTLKTSEQLHLYIVDPKRIDLTMFDGLPHVKKIMKEPEEFFGVMAYLYDEVQNRQKFLERYGARNIAEFNANPLRKNKMAYKVLVIDEYADLKEKASYIGMKSAVEAEILRLIQVCRASGIHIILCTQRTTVDIVTGSVKANFPTRISLRLPTKTDSRTILDENGAENLLGNGDMLLKSAFSDGLERYHAPFVRIEDIKMILDQQEMIKESLGVIG